MLGVSSDSLASHCDYARRLQLPFRLLSDADGAVRARFQVPAFLGLLPGRATLVIDRRRRLAAACRAQLRYELHARVALDALRRLDAEPPG